MTGNIDENIWYQRSDVDEWWFGIREAYDLYVGMRALEDHSAKYESDYFCHLHNRYMNALDCLGLQDRDGRMLSLETWYRFKKQFDDFTNKEAA